MKRFGMPVVVAGLVVALGLALRSRSELAYDDGNAVRVQPTGAAYVPLPVNFRQNQPRHWRYMMLSPGR